jgi:hypothetical protein
MFIPRKTDFLILPILFGFILFASSYHGKFHLRPEMPAGFYQQDRSSRRPSLDEKIAWAYWETAVMDVQWKYGYAHPLPPDPPEDFQIDAKALGPTASDPATRMLYWHRLQQVWYLPETWSEDYGWDLGWLSAPVISAGNWVKDEAGRLIPAHF